MSVNILSLENDMNRAQPTFGVTQNQPAPRPQDFLDTTGLAIAAGGSTVLVNYVSGATGDPVLSWPEGATTAAIAFGTFILDDQFCEDKKHVTLKFDIRKWGTGTDDTSLAVQFTFQAKVPGDATTKTVLSGTKAKYTPTTLVTTNVVETATFKLHELCSATQLGYLQRGTKLIIRAAPSKTVGTALNLDLCMSPVELRRHIAVAETLANKEPLYV